MKHLRENRGAAYIVVLVAVMTGLILGVAAMDVATFGSRVESSRQTSERVRLLAETGVRYGYWLIKWNNVTARPYTTSLTFGGATIDIAVYDNSVNLAVSDRIVASVNYRGARASLSRVVSRPRALFDNAVAVNSYTGTVSVPIISTDQADIFLPGNITINNSATNLSGDLYATGSIWVSSGTVNGGLIRNSSGFSFPLIDTAGLMLQARTVYLVNKTFSNINFPSDGDVIYVGGTLTLTGGTVSGKGTIVAVSGINITGNYDPGGDSMLALLTTGTATLQNTCSKFTGILYAHALLNNASINLMTSTQLKGPIIGDTIYCWGSLLPDYDSAKFNPANFRLLHIPGY
ncbi:MAG: hypothetical protein IT209_08495 [Armatimonadetes bacterium]|nr:hypothetical protein [Armatimonadota bacterium]